MVNMKTFEEHAREEKVEQKRRMESGRAQHDQYISDVVKSNTDLVMSYPNNVAITEEISSKVLGIERKTTIVIKKDIIE